MINLTKEVMIDLNNLYLRSILSRLDRQTIVRFALFCVKDVQHLNTDPSISNVVNLIEKWLKDNDSVSILKKYKLLLTLLPVGVANAAHDDAADAVDDDAADAFRTAYYAAAAAADAAVSAYYYAGNAAAAYYYVGGAAYYAARTAYNAAFAKANNNECCL